MDSDHHPLQVKIRREGEGNRGDRKHGGGYGTRRGVKNLGKKWEDCRGENGRRWRRR